MHPHFQVSTLFLEVIGPQTPIQQTKPQQVLGRQHKQLVSQVINLLAMNMATKYWILSHDPSMGIIQLLLGRMKFAIFLSRVLSLQHHAANMFPGCPKGKFNGLSEETHLFSIRIHNQQFENPNAPCTEDLPTVTINLGYSCRQIFHTRSIWQRTILLTVFDLQGPRYEKTNPMTRAKPLHC